MASPFHRYLNTNFKASDYDMACIKALITEKKTIVDQIDEEIRALVERKSAHLKFIDEHTSLMAPVRRLPADILSSVFSILLNEKPTPEWRRNDECGERQSSKIHPMVICSHVCEEWRHLVLSTPTLWSIIDLVMPEFPQGPKEPEHFPLNNLPRRAWEDHNEEILKWKAKTTLLKRRLHTLLQRSGHSPLKISFKVCALDFRTVPEPEGRRYMVSIDRSGATRACANNLADILISHKDRWREMRLLSAEASTTLFMRVDYHLNIHGLRGGGFGDDAPFELPCLQVFEQHVPVEAQSQAEYFDHRVETKILSAPSLRVLRLHKSAVDTRSDMGALKNWSSLTHITLLDAFQWQPHRDSYKEMAIFQMISTRDLLEHCVGLTHCQIEFWYPGDRQFRPGEAEEYRAEASTFERLKFREVISHANLVSICISGHVIPNGLAQWLEFPKLRILSICTTSAFVLAGGHNGVLEWIEKFGPQLTDISFTYSNMSQESLESCWECLPNITSLTTRAVGGYGVCEYADADDNQDYVLPALLDDRTLSRLTPDLDDVGKAPSQCFCPKLETFSCRIGTCEFTEQAFVEFVAARLPALGDTAEGQAVGAGLGSKQISFLKHIELSSQIWDTSNVRHKLEEKGADLWNCRMRLVYPSPADDTHYLSNRQYLTDENFLPI